MIAHSPWCDKKTAGAAASLTVPRASFLRSRLLVPRGPEDLPGHRDGLLQVRDPAVKLHFVNGARDAPDERPGLESHGQQVPSHQEWGRGLALHPQRAHAVDEPFLCFGGKLTGAAAAI